MFDKTSSWHRSNARIVWQFIAIFGGTLIAFSIYGRDRRKKLIAFCFYYKFILWKYSRKKFKGIETIGASHQQNSKSERGRPNRLF